MKYMGSKARFAKYILPIVLKDRKPGQPYVEPFAGGMNMICNVPAEQGPRYAADCNEYVIAMFRAIQWGWTPPLSVSREEYAEAKAGKYDDALTGYIGFNCSYSGKWFGGYAGIVETQGGTRNYQEEAYRNVLKQCESLKDVYFAALAYNEIDIPPNSIIYCDPPYEGTTAYRNAFSHPDFWQWCRDKADEGHSVFVSEYNAPDEFTCIWQKEAKSSLSANGQIGGNKVSIEKLFKQC